MYIDEAKIKDIVAKSNNKKQCIEKLGLHPTSTTSYRTLNFYITKFELDISHFFDTRKSSRMRERIPLEDILNGHHPLFQTCKLKNKLIKANILEHKCSVCNLSEWNNLPIPLDLDHINGVSTDHSINNLRLICRNCHAQTDNFCGKNKSDTIFNKDKKISHINTKNNKNKSRIDKIINSEVDFSKYGWVTKIAKILSISPQKVTPWMKKHMSDFYRENCFRKTV